ncbi:uncharacterized protein AC631_05365 [Debaryomyces fabryi]|uniref:Uncharacterized protein n=1 Tax=Debaryomyces fabryi TaxID=58627 RepID=A0A0V1PRK8_9ASCO|nr:uncharacterized protein AC631_05365 [Debaryomyces fabryi]KRZ98877.1 hypothetical protein AC631_05365 [Debaryomyces fabryi]
MEKTLSYLSPDELTCKFDLDNLIYEKTFSSYHQVRQIAFSAKYQGTHVTISNMNINNSLQLSDSQLRYIITKEMTIRPREISLVLFDCNSIYSYTYINFMLSHYLKKLKLFTNRFNFQLNIYGDNLIGTELLLNAIFQHFICCDCTVNWFAINYKTVKQYNEFEKSLFSEKGYKNPSIENLKLSLFNSSKLRVYFAYFKNHNCHLCHNLKTLDLSYNNIDDEFLARLYFPPLIQDLDLSNNNIYTLSDSFNISNLNNLKKLDLSNNNLIKISISLGMSSKLEVLVLSGNNLHNCNFLHKPLFQNLVNLNLSRNLISNLANLPLSLKILDLSGNFLSSFFNEQTMNVFPESLVQLNLAWCKIGIDDRLNSIGSKPTLKLENLPRLKSLILTGNRYHNFYSELLQVWE